MAATPDVSLIASSFVEFGGLVLKQGVLDWQKASDGISIHTNVSAPEVLPKANTTGQPMPYRKQDDFTVSSVDNGVQFTDRILTVNQTKWDFQIDLENFRNNYLHKYMKDGMTEAQAINQYMADKYVDYAIQKMGNGTYNASGTTAAAMLNGFLTIIAAEITATTLTPIATGATSTTTAVAAFEKLVEACPTWMREQGGIVYCSYAEFDKFKKDYRTRYTFIFDKEKKEFQMDNLNFVIKPRSWMGTSSRLIATVDGNLVFGTDVSKLQIAATPHLNLINTRILFPMGCQIADLGAIVVGDQA